MKSIDRKTRHAAARPPFDGTAMAVAAGENVAYMLQPFFAMPVVAMAGIGIQRVMGYTVVTFLVAGAGRRRSCS